jgi:hypothetical protein
MTSPSTPSDDHAPLAQRLALAGEGSDRHDGWTPARMAAFCEALAATGCVDSACHHLGMAKSGLYEARRRNPLFALAWEDALIDGALPRLADELLSHAFRGSVERFYRDGECVGEKHFTDTRLGLALLKRLDRKAAERAAADLAARLRDEATENAAKEREQAAAEEARHAAAHDPFEDGEVDEVDPTPFCPTLVSPHPRILRTEHGWQTSFPPPAVRAPEDDWAPLDFGPDEDSGDPDALYDPLAILDLAAENRWPGSPGYKRYCTRAESLSLDRWVDRQLQPVHAEHARFFEVLEHHGGNDEATALLPPADRAANCREP